MSVIEQRFDLGDAPGVTEQQTAREGMAFVIPAEEAYELHSQEPVARFPETWIDATTGEVLWIGEGDPSPFEVGELVGSQVLEALQFQDSVGGMDTRPIQELLESLEFTPRGERCLDPTCICQPDRDAAASSATRSEEPHGPSSLRSAPVRAGRALLGWGVAVVDTVIDLAVAGYTRRWRR